MSHLGSAIKRNKVLQVVNFAACGFDSHDAVVLADALSHSVLETFVLSDNTLGKAGCQQLLRASCVNR